ncbi:MAE_28990/MAE_18760 family HEPN-like nuclease [Halovibrio sp. HP20-50]|uniref:MAE_28990/MAE_18760 family HEPN-like nuclease n=1 Tax=Halovibrio sp. HP20-59 TaxID=3080275 RepID=UPI00294B195B|nr:MAE_28990/MAE_18760 family HEPN-like nuclease [Halovibrio sp. HP20-59]MEA2118120.1 MAE_28990/MAE_18760 family HEPN-like nuclease [Halovibrio sp. HP20-59]
MLTVDQKQYFIDEAYLSFRDRCAEVKQYMSFVSLIGDNGYDHLASVDSGILTGGVVQPLIKIDRDLEKTLRSSGLLLIYNLVEATMSNAIDAIHKVIKEEGVSYYGLSDNLKKITATHFKRAVNGDIKKVFDENDHPISIAMAYVGYDKKGLFSGNIDCKAIRKAADKYGFHSPMPDSENRVISQVLYNIKDKRNALAHGRNSFLECGQDIAPDALPLMAHHTIVYLRAILWSVSHYIRTDGYKKP